MTIGTNSTLLVKQLVNRLFETKAMTRVARPGASRLLDFQIDPLLDNTEALDAALSAAMAIKLREQSAGVLAECSRGPSAPTRSLHRRPRASVSTTRLSHLGQQRGRVAPYEC